MPITEIMDKSHLIEHFYKYQSLGNHFIIFDWRNKNQASIESLLLSASWPSLVQKLCTPNTSIGGNNVLVFYNNNQLRIFNADGTEAENCLNGLRCIALHYAQSNKLSEHQFTINTTDHTITCSISNRMITTYSPSAINKGQLISMGKIGNVILTGNPHFIVQEDCSLKWLSQHGASLEHDPQFPNKTNVEFLWKKTDKQNEYNMLIHERGVGITSSCSSGAAAAVWLLFTQNRCESEEKIIIHMPGGSLTTWINTENAIALHAPAFFLYQGDLSQEHITYLLRNC